MTQWNDSKYCCFLDFGDASNSDLNYAAVRVKYDRSINRIYLLFMLDFKEFNDINLGGVIMNFNGMGNIELRFDGTEDYDGDIYFAQIDEEAHDENSKDVMAETTVGIKSGIPDKVIMTVTVFDTNGVRSNLYSVDITEDAEDETTEKTEETKSEKTTKKKTTKTTKIKTTKSKKAKTSKPTKTKKTDMPEETEGSQTVIDYSMNGKIEANDKKKKVMLVLGAAAAAVAVASGCVAGIKNRKKDKDGGH